MSRIAGTAEVGDAHKRSDARVDLEGPRGGDVGERLHARGEAVLFEQLRKHGRCSLVEWTAAGDAEDRMIHSRTAFNACQARTWIRGTRLSARFGILILVVAQVLDDLFDC